MEKITTVGIDLAKNVFSLHGVDASGKVVFRRTMRRTELLHVVAGLPPCVIGMEACSGSHAWARQFRAFNHDARLMAPSFVVPYRKSGKNDGNDAEAISSGPYTGELRSTDSARPSQRGESHASRHCRPLRRPSLQSLHCSCARCARRFVPLHLVPRLFAL